MLRNFDMIGTVAVIGVLGLVGCSVFSVKPKRLITVEVMCPMSTVDVIRDTVTHVRRFDYYSSNLVVYRNVDGVYSGNRYPNTCLVREVPSGS